MPTRDCEDLKPHLPRRHSNDSFSIELIYNNPSRSRFLRTAYILVNMDAAAKQPVKLVKVIRVLGRTGEFLHVRAASVWTFLTRMSTRLARWCDTSQSRVHGRHKQKYHSQREGTRYECAHLGPGANHVNHLHSQGRRYPLPTRVRT